MRAARALGTLYGYIIFSILYAFVIGSYAALSVPFRLLKRREKDLVSYWKEKEYVEPTLESLRHPF